MHWKLSTRARSMGGLSEIPFLIDFWSLNTFPLKFWAVGKTHFFTSNFQKFGFFKKKTLLLKFCRGYRKYSKMAAQSKMADFLYSVNCFVLENIHILWKE
jgi:hypothetical protein